MFSENVLGMFKNLVDWGIEVSLHMKGAEPVYYADLHTHAKSHLHVYEKDGKIIFDMRYGRTEEVDVDESVEALTYHAAACYAYNCICGRSYGSPAWDALCTEMGVTVEYGQL